MMKMLIQINIIILDIKLVFIFFTSSHFLHFQILICLKILGVDISLSVHIYKRKDVLVLGEGPTQGSDDTTITGEAKCWVNFSRSRKKMFP